MRHAELRSIGVLAVGSALACGVVAFLPSFWAYLAVAVVIQAVAVLSVGVVFGRARLLALCQLGFAAVGAWTMCWFATHAPETPFVLQILVSSLASVPFGVLIGLPTLRLRGDIVAVVTLSFAVAIEAILVGVGFPGEDQLIAVRRPEWLGTNFSFFIFCVVALFLVAAFLVFLDNGRLGTKWSIVGSSERALASYGHSTAWAKVSAFAVASFIAGLSGALLAAQVGNITASSFTVVGSLSLFALAVLSGSRWVSGAVIGGILVVGVPEILRALGLPLDLAALLFGIGAVQALIAGSGGMAGSFHRAIAARRIRKLAAAGLLHRDLAGGDEEPESVSTVIRTLPTVPDDPGAAAPTALLKADKLSVSYGAIAALDSVDLSVPGRHVVALIGPNGAGKSTFVDSLSGFVAEATGAVTLGEDDISRKSAPKRSRSGLRRTFQQSKLLTELTIEQFLRVAAGGRYRREEGEQLVRFLGLPPLHMPIAALDIGSRRILEVAGTLISRPRVVMLDEPAAGLTEHESVDLAKRVRAIPMVYGASVLVIDHDMTFVQLAADQMYVLDFGRVIASGDPDDVLRDPAVTTAYLGEVTM